MAIPDPNLGIPVGFDGEGFRNAIKFAMQMGTPTLPDGSPDPDKRPIFIKKVAARIYKDAAGNVIPPPRVDRDGRPFDPTIQVEESRPDPITDADCAVEVDRADADELPVGNFRPTKAVVTLLDVDYERVKDCRELVYNGDRYVYGYEPENNGLFDVGVHTMIYYAVDET
jgi:hypothetical protein